MTLSLNASSNKSGLGISTGRVICSARTGRLSLDVSTSPNVSTCTSSYFYKSASYFAEATPLNSLSTNSTTVGLGNASSANRSQGANVEKAASVPAVQSIPCASSIAGTPISSSLSSPTVSNVSPRRLLPSSQSSHLTSQFNASKVCNLVTASGIGLDSSYGTTPH
ncbi:MAG: hypothetical protein NXY57DRAFT_959934 [Lentinula lateritia]|nr:MAG: hypothetical protein NXY57DRAFT_959934 [Lentinula lateritia]